jgi:NitT/TauT family transport system ATP-binding protein
MQSDIVVRCRNVSRTYELRDDAPNRVLQNIDLNVNEGEFVVLIGPSGCGKSTLLNIIAGFDKASSGTVEVSGKPVRGPGPDKAMVFQDYALLPWLDARGNVEIGLRLQGYDEASRRAEAERMLALVGLGHAMRRPVYKLSGGMQQRVSIARALALKPKILLMDEPFGALDAFQRAIMHRELLEIWKTTGTSIIFVTHSLEEALFLGTRIIAMSPGQVLAGEISVDLPTPRDPLSPKFAAYKQQLFGMIRAHIDDAAEVFVE